LFITEDLSFRASSKSTSIGSCSRFTLLVKEVMLVKGVLWTFCKFGLFLVF